MALTAELVITAFLAILLFAQIISQKLKIPYTLTLVFVGIIIVGFSTLPVVEPNMFSNLFQGVVSSIRSFYSNIVQQGLFVGLVVPPLIFEAMIHIKQEDLRHSFRPSFLLATVGVVISTIVCGLVLWYLNLPLPVAFIFAALISPTDVVTVLELFRRINVPTRLATILELEAALNDATAIVVFSIVISSIEASRVPFLRSIIEFGITIGGGVVVGAFVGIAASALNNYIKESIPKTILSVTAVYGSYVFASGLGLSGLIAVAFTGLYFGNRILSNEKDTTTRETVLTFWQIAAFLGNSVAFLFIGFQTDLFTISGYIPVIVIAYLAVILARIVSVYPIFGILSQVGDRIPLSWSNATALGGVRGAVSIALTSTLATAQFLTESDFSLLTAMVVGVVFISVLAQVPLLLRYVKRANLWF